MTKEKDDGPNFEEALAELEAIARDLEESSCGLDEALRRFEQGVALLRRCYGLLDAAERKVAILTGFDAEGNPVLEPYDDSATAEQGTPGRRKARRGRAAAPAEADESGDLSAEKRGLF